MRWLPAIWIGPSRYHLPRSLAVETALVHSLASITVAPAVAKATIQSAIERDPPLALFAVDRWISSQLETQNGATTRTSTKTQTGATTQIITTAELAAHFCDQIVDQFADFDGLGCASVDPALAKRWASLRTEFRDVPVDRWLGRAADWFDAIGPIPAAGSWRGSQWSLRVSPPEIDTTSTDVVGMLARQARSLDHLQMRFAERLAIEKRKSLGQFAYGLSHEINNPLANISARAQSLMSQSSVIQPSVTQSSVSGSIGDEKSNDDRDPVLQQIVDQSYRAYGMIADLMFYARPPEPEKRPFDLSEVVADVSDEFCGDEFCGADDAIEIQCDVAPAITIIGDQTMIGEAVRMLIRNAYEAVLPAGKIIVTAAATDSQITITICDSGPGLSAEARRHAMDPYFSGREAGRGLGMGLCRAIGVMELHDGTIELSGGPVGCIATMTLPRTGSADRSPEKTFGAKTSGAKIPGAKISGAKILGADERRSDR